MDAALTFTAVENGFEARWARLWPALRAWYLRDGDAARPTYLEARQALHRHMPELAGVWETWSAGMGDVEARALSLYDPPAPEFGCSVAARDGALTRNYDYDPGLIEGTIARSTLLRPVLGMSDCVWGLLDGVNDAGLAVALAFGGRRAHGRGFAITLILRYLLETCDTVAQACDVACRLPVHAPYNVVLTDGHDAATLYLGPDRAPRVLRPALAANQQEDGGWPGSAVRLEALHGDAPDFLAPPLHTPKTLYTAVYRPASRTATYRWPGHADWDLALDAFTPAMRTVRLSEGADRHVGARPR